MIFWILLGVIVLGMTLSVVTKYHEEWAAFTMAVALVSLVAIPVLMTNYGPPQAVYVHNVSNVRAYPNPNEGTVYSFEYNGKTLAMDQGGDGMIVEPGSDENVLIKYRSDLHRWWNVPWHAYHTYYVLKATKVN